MAKGDSISVLVKYISKRKTTIAVVLVTLAVLYILKNVYETSVLGITRRKLLTKLNTLHEANRLRQIRIWVDEHRQEYYDGHSGNAQWLNNNPWVTVSQAEYDSWTEAEKDANGRGYHVASFMSKDSWGVRLIDFENQTQAQTTFYIYCQDLGVDADNFMVKSLFNDVGKSWSWVI